MMHLSLTERINALALLGHQLDQADDRLQEAVRQAGFRNPWFTERQCFRALRGIREEFLDREVLRHFAARYRLPEESPGLKAVGIVMAGNIPAVGFHDWLCVFLGGHEALVKLSDKDAVLIPHLLKRLEEIAPAAEACTRIVDRLVGFDAVIATGSDNSSRYFHHYFGKYPHLIRGNRNGVAVLFGDESLSDLQALGTDIFSYFGLGCRNVSHLYVPHSYDFGKLLGVLDGLDELADHDRYRSNYDYQCALLLLNNTPFLQGANVLLREDPSLLSPMACLTYSVYHDLSELQIMLEERKTSIQCLVSTQPIADWDVVQPGNSQSPGIDDFADGADTLRFLIELGHEESR